MRFGFFRQDKGSVLPITGLCVVMGLGILALGIDLGHLFLVKNELQRDADAAALAGALRLMTPAGGIARPVSTSPDCFRARTAAQTVATSNSADAEPLPSANLDIRLGTYDMATRVFTDTGCANPAAVNAVQATASKAVSIYIGSLLTGRSTVTLTAVAVALTGVVGSLEPGTHTLPLAVDHDKLPSNGRELIIHLNPTPGDDGCWHTFFWQNPASSLLRDLINNRVESPPLKVGDQIKVKEGVDDAALKDLGGALQDHGGTWDTMLPVIPADQHSGWAEVLGFVAVRLTMVDPHGQDKYIRMETLNNYVAPGALPGGTNNYGLSAGAPRLVQ